MIKHLRNPFLCGIICLILWQTLSFRVDGQSNSAIIFDQHQSAVFGSYNLLTLHRGLYTLEDKYIPNQPFRENNFWKKTAGFGYRLVKLLALDAQIDHLMALTQHEVFGHGSRFREFGYTGNSFNLNMYFPFGNGSGFARWGTLGPKYTYPTTQEVMTMQLSGVGGEAQLANDLSAQILSDDTLHYRQGMLYLIAQNNLLLYTFYTRFTPTKNLKAGNDMVNYMNQINYLYLIPVGKNYNITRLSNQSLLALANPLQAYAAFSILYTYGIKGQSQLKRLPMIRMGKVRYLPALGYALSPFGGEFHFINYIRYKSILFCGDFSLGDNTFKDFYGISLKGYNILNLKWLALNAHLDFWNQPKLELDSYQKPAVGNDPGAAVKLDMMLHPFKLPHQLGIFLQTGYKSKGYLLGETLAPSFILRYGISMHF